MPRRKDIKKVLVIGSGPIVIGQAAEFDYAGTQACLALKEEGYEVILANSNPATIMTDTRGSCGRQGVPPGRLLRRARPRRHELFVKLNRSWNPPKERILMRSKHPNISA